MAFTTSESRLAVYPKPEVSVLALHYPHPKCIGKVKIGCRPTNLGVGSEGLGRCRVALEKDCTYFVDYSLCMHQHQIARFGFVQCIKYRNSNNRSHFRLLLNYSMFGSRWKKVLPPLIIYCGSIARLSSHLTVQNYKYLDGLLKPTRFHHLRTGSNESNPGPKKVAHFVHMSGGPMPISRLFLSTTSAAVENAQDIVDLHLFERGGFECHHGRPGHEILHIVPKEQQPVAMHTGYGDIKVAAD
jgi:hypothetical protein